MTVFPTSSASLPGKGVGVIVGVGVSDGVSVIVGVGESVGVRVAVAGRAVR